MTETNFRCKDAESFVLLIRHLEEVGEAAKLVKPLNDGFVVVSTGDVVIYPTQNPKPHPIERRVFRGDIVTVDDSALRFLDLA